jgi:hypothetical protein
MPFTVDASLLGHRLSVAMQMLGIEQDFAAGLATSDPQQMLDKAAARLRRSSLVREYLKLARSANPKVTTPWMALAEKLALALGVFTGRVGVQIGHGPTAGTDQHRIIEGVMLVAATPFLWSSSIDRVVRASPLPPHVIGRDLLMEPIMFWSSDEDQARLLVCGDSAEVITVRDIGVGADGRAVVALCGILRYGSRYPEDVHVPKGETPHDVLQRLAFLRSPYVETRRERLPRPWRRAAARDGEPCASDDVAVVLLRRAARDNVRAEAADAGRVEWKHQWWVSAHYRAQWYPSKQAHEVIWIAPHLKGPADAPFADRVYAVKR